MGKTLILFTNNQSYYFDRIRTPQIEIQGVFKNGLEFKSPILKLFRKAKSRFTYFYYQKWYKNINQYQKIIVFDTPLQYDAKLLENIAHKATEAELYIYSWNKVINCANFERVKKVAEKLKFKFYSYDLGDCAKYGLYFNTIMYDQSLQLKTGTEQTDALFLGFLKDRKDDMILLYQLLVAANLVPRFVVVGTEEQDNLLFEYKYDYVGYYDYLEMVVESRAIVDIAQQGQSGYSMRVMEAIFLNKKLITTNKEIQNADFYNPNNILIIDLEKTTQEEVIGFFNTPLIQYAEDIRQYYSIEMWVERFEK